ncbi:hypothetical protein [Janibacter sp. G56]|uniref:hypothetical protein n=1 Tax=Janibacter sp. G56 TaxID=3418717 RepID=UPI003D062A9B
MYLAFGFGGILLVDAPNATEANEVYRKHFDCDRTWIEHIMYVPEPELWGTYYEESVEDCAYTKDENCEFCEGCETYLGFGEMVIAPDDPRLTTLDVEADKAAVSAAVDQLFARWHDVGRWHDQHPDATFPDVLRAVPPLDPSLPTARDVEQLRPEDFA